VNFPKLTAIPNLMFQNCTSLTAATAENFPAVTTIIGGFNSCTSLTTVSLPSVTDIGNYAFQSCTSLTTVNLPSAASVGNGAFDRSTTSVSAGINPCDADLTITLGNPAPTVGTLMFQQIATPKNVTVKYPYGATGYDSTWEEAFRYKGTVGTGTPDNSNITISFETL
jgi:hypothetical protein